MKDLLKIKAFIWALLLGAAFAVGCDDDDPLEAERLFTPVFKENSFGGTWIQVKWDKFKDVDAYVVSLSKDNFLTTEQEVITDTNECMFENLDYDTKYMVGIRALGGGKTSHTLTLEITTEDYPTLLATPTAADAIDVAIRAKWDTDETQPAYKYLDLYKKSNDSLMERYELTAEEMAAKEKFFYGLLPETEYVVRAYDADNNYCGKKSYSTAAAENYSGYVEDLRSLEAEEAYEYLNDNFAAICAGHDSVTIVLQGATDYKIKNTLNIPSLKSFVLATGLSFKGNANLYMEASFDTEASAEIGEIVFKNINFTAPEEHKSAGSFGGKYVFSIQNNGVANVESILFEGCDIRYKRGVFKVKTAGVTVNNVTFKGCMVDSIADYGLIQIEKAKSTIKNIKILESTIAFCQKMVYCGGDANTEIIETVEMANVTTYRTPNSGQALIGCSKMQTMKTIKISNCIFGPGNGGAIKGVVTGNNLAPALQEVYYPSDTEWSDSSLKGEGLATDCGSASAVLFTDPVGLNFKLTDKNLIEKAGDPRWW